MTDAVGLEIRFREGDWDDKDINEGEHQVRLVGEGDGNWDQNE